ncbi:hypothetical protein [Mesorhizobium sp. M0037]|uniref:TOTE conflict system archaeo-eukaryotic primase domain-containing protein n=1 Tax=unclassified Mesorhizobium TaxID=325217 RepID=UPI003337DE8D
MNAMSQPEAANPLIDKAASFHDVFAGSDEKHGKYHGPLRLVGDKMEMKDAGGNGAVTVPGPATAELWRLHLDGTVPLGVHPLRSDGMCRWGVIDLDGKDVDGGYAGINHADLVGACAKEGLPLVICRSKSGGAHLFLFLADWTPQASVGRALTHMAVRLGYPDADAYPPSQGVGNWINMPYFKGEESDRYCVKKGRPLGISVAEFIDWAETNKVSASQLAEIARPKRENRLDTDGPDRANRELMKLCLEIAGQRDGGRGVLLNKHAFKMGTMVGAGWIGEEEVFAALLRAASQDSVDPLPLGQVMGHIKNGLEAGREKPAEDDADADRYPKIDQLVVWTGGDEAEWEFRLAGWPPVQMTVREAMNFRHFNTRCAAEGIGPFRPLKELPWNDLLAEALRGAEVREIPQDETVEFQFQEMLYNFLFDRHHGTSMDDALTGRPVHDEDADRVYFKVAGLRDHACRTSGEFRHATAHKLGTMLNGIGGPTDQGKTTKKIKGKTVELRWMRMSLFDKQTEPLSVPPVPGEPI